MHPPWLAHYDAGVPPTLAPYPDRTLVDLRRAPRARAPATIRRCSSRARASTYGAARPAEHAFAAALARRRRAPGRPRRAAAAQLPAVLHRASSAPGRSARSSRRSIPIYTERELEAPLRDTGAETIVTLTPLLRAREGGAAAHRACGASSPTNIKEYLPPLLRCCSRSSARRRTAIASRSQPATRGSSDAARARTRRSPRRARAGRRRTIRRCMLMSGGTTGTPKGVVGLHGAYVQAGLQLAAWIESATAARGPTSSCCRCRCSTSTRNVGVQALAFVGAQSARARAEPARHRRRADDDPAA